MNHSGDVGNNPPRCLAAFAAARVELPGVEFDGHGTATARARGVQGVYICDPCGRQPLELFARFEYPDDLFDGDFADFAGREQDLFTWFSLAGKCPECSRLLAVADFECA